MIRALKDQRYKGGGIPLTSLLHMTVTLHRALMVTLEFKEDKDPEEIP